MCGEYGIDITFLGLRLELRLRLLHHQITCFKLDFRLSLQGSSPSVRVSVYKQIISLSSPHGVMDALRLHQRAADGGPRYVKKYALCGRGTSSSPPHARRCEFTGHAGMSQSLWNVGLKMFSFA